MWQYKSTLSIDLASLLLPLPEPTVLRLENRHYALHVHIPFQEVAHQRPLPLLAVQRVKVEVVQVYTLQVQELAQLKTVKLQLALVLRAHLPSRIELLFLFFLFALRWEWPVFWFGEIEKPVLFCFVDVADGLMHVLEEEGDVFLDEVGLCEQLAVFNYGQLCSFGSRVDVVVVEDEDVD